MKKFFLLAVALVAGGSAFAQKGATALGVGALYSTKSEKFGLAIKGQYNITNPLRAEAEFDLFFPEHGHCWGLNLNAQYLFTLAPGAKAYPLVGLNYTHVGVSGVNDSEIGINVGGGIEYNITSNLAFNFEAKYQSTYSGTGLLNAGLIYRF